MATGFLSFLIPKNVEFFDLFNQSSAVNMQMAELLFAVVSGDSPDENTLHLNQISRLKQTGNEIKHKVYLASAKAFVSPFARSEMYALASAINNICDYIHISSRRFSLFQSGIVSPTVKELSGIIIETCTELQSAIKALDNLDNSDAIKEYCNKVKSLEHYADQVYGKAVSAIMSVETNSVEVIKYTEILSALERTTDKCEHATTVIESIIIKNK